MDVSTFTRFGVARWLRELRCFAREEPLSPVLQRRLLTARTRLDADGVIWVGDVVAIVSTVPGVAVSVRTR